MLLMLFDYDVVFHVAWFVLSQGVPYGDNDFNI